MTQYAHLFNRPGQGATDSIEDQFLFCANLGAGVTGCAQLVFHVASNTPCVRKTITPRLPAELMHDEYNSAEKQVLEYLQSQPDNDQPPFLNRLWYCDDIRPDPNSNPFRALYLDYCNGGDLQQLRNFLALSGTGMARRLILRLVKHMATALNYLYTRPDPILHRDLKMANIFCHWTSAGALDFYLGDFGFASIGNTTGALEDLEQFVDIIENLANLPGPRLGGAQDTPAVENLLLQIRQEIKARGDEAMPSDVLPDFSNLMALVAQIPEEEVAEPWRAYNVHNAHLRTAVPCYYRTREECLQPHMRGTAVHGPWHVASVSPSDADLVPRVNEDEVRIQVTILTGGERVQQTPPGPKVVDWESEWQHRPNFNSEDPWSGDE